MNIWLVNPYGPIPGEGWRKYRYTMMAEALSDAGNQVIWWTSSFSHHFKRYRSQGWQDLRISNNFTIRLVPTTRYKKNIGIGRILRDCVFALRAYIHGKKSSSPDCIIYSESPLTMGYAGFKLSEHHGCAVIYDQMDLWPELFVKVTPKMLRPILECMLMPVYAQRNKIFKKLDSAIGLAESYLESVLIEAPNLRSRPHGIVYNGIDVFQFRKLLDEDKVKINGLPDKDPNDIWAVFAGSLGASYDILTLIEVAKRLVEKKSNIKLIIAGDGPLKEKVHRYSSDSLGAALYYVGKLPPEKLAVLYKMSDVGICAYSTKSNVEMPDKFYDYTAAGLAVLNSLQGEVRATVCENEIGLQYKAGNVEDLLAKLEKFSDNRELLDNMAHNAYKIGMVYDRHNQYTKILDIVKMVVK